MTLEFRAPFAIDPNAPSQKQRSLATLGQTFSDLGNTAMQYSQQNKENKIRQAMLQLQQQQGQREQGAYNYEYGDPATNGSAGNPTTAPAPTGSQQTPMGPQGYESPASMQSLPGPAPTQSYPQMADAGTPDTGYPSTPQPGQPMHQPGTDLTAHFNAWQQQGQPPQYDHQDLGGTGQGMRPNPMSGFDTSAIMNIPGAKRQDHAMSIFKTQAEINKMNAEAGVSKFYNEAQATPMIGPEKARTLSQAYGGQIPKDAVHAMLTSQGQANAMGRFGSQQAEGFNKALDPNQMRGGVLSLLQRKINSADALDALYQQSGGNPTPQQMQELVLGTANMLSNGSLAAEGIVQGLMPKSLQGNIMAGAQWLRNQPMGAEQQAFAKNLHDTMMREKSVAQKQLRTAQLQDASAWQNQVDPDTYNRVIGARGLRGYSLGPNGDLIEPQGQGGAQGGQAGGVPQIGGTFNGERVRKVTRIK